jgi:hypothetical protein
MLAGARKPRITRWYVDSDGKRTGPYSLGQLQTEFRAGRVRPDSQALPVNEDGNIEGQVLPVRQLLDLYLDPAVSLFDTLRAAKEKRAPQKKHWSVPDPEKANAPAQSVFKKIPDQAWIFSALAIVCVLLVYVAVSLVRQSNQLLTRGEENGQARALRETPLPRAPRAPAPRATTVARPFTPPVQAQPHNVIARPTYRTVTPPARREDDRRDDRDPRDERRDDLRDDMPIDRDPRDRLPAQEPARDPDTGRVIETNPPANPQGNTNEPTTSAVGQ